MMNMQKKQQQQKRQEISKEDVEIRRVIEREKKHTQRRETASERSE